MEAMHVLNFLTVSSFVNASTDKKHFSSFFNVGHKGGMATYYSEIIELVGVGGCFEMCKTTKECKYINYDVYSKTCYFIGVQEGTNHMVANGVTERRGYIFGDKSEWTLGKYSICSDCEDHGQCRKDKLQNDVYSDCRNSGCGPPPAFTGSKIHGNMFSTGHKVFYECETGFVPVGNSISTCLANGTWSLGEPVCIHECVCYEWTYADYVAVTANSVLDQEGYCVLLGFVFTQGDDTKCSGCGNCWCCRRL